MNKGRMTALLVFAMAFLGGVGEHVSHAAVNVINNQLAFQGFLQNAQGVALNGTYKMKFQIMKNGSAIWQKVSTPTSVTVTNGVFSYLFTGNDDSAIPLKGTLFATTSSSDVFTVTVQVNVTQDNVTYDSYSGLPLTASPTAMVADYANQALGIQGYAVSSTTPTANQILQWNANTWSPTTPSFTLSGDVSGTTGASSVIGLQGVSVSSTAPSSGNVLTYSGGVWTPMAASSLVAGSGIGISGSTIKVTGVTASNMVAGDYSGIVNTGTYGINISGNAATATSISGTVGVANGGTGLTGITAGELLYGSGSNVISALPTGTNGQYLTLSSGVPAWSGVSVSSFNGDAAYVSTGGTTTAYTLAATGFSLATGAVVTFKANATSTGAATLNVNGTGAKNLYQIDNSAALPTGGIVINNYYRATYNGTNWLVENVSQGAQSVQGGSSYTATAGTGTAATLALPGFILVPGAMVSFKLTTSNTNTTPTLAVNGTAATTMTNIDGTALVANQLVANQFYRAIYNGTNWLVESATRFLYGSGAITTQSPTASAAVTSQTVTVPGAVAGDPVYCSPSVAMTATTIGWVPYVSAANTVTIVLTNTNTSGSTGTPTFKCVVIKSP